MRQPPIHLLEMLTVLVQQIEEAGYVPTVTQKPRLPPAMGHYQTVVELRPARKTYQGES